MAGSAPFTEHPEKTYEDGVMAALDELCGIGIIDDETVIHEAKGQGVSVEHPLLAQYIRDINEEDE